MKNFINVLLFEINNYFKSKSYLLTTIIVSVILIIGLSLPSFFDFSSIIPQLSKGEVAEEATEEETSEVEEDQGDSFDEIYAIYDKGNVFENTEYLSAAFRANWKVAASEEEVKKLVDIGDVDGGFVVNSLTDYIYYVENKSMYDYNEETFSDILLEQYKVKKFAEEGIDYNKVSEINGVEINSEVMILGKDSGANYFYAYLLVFLLYMMIIIYGQLIAVSVTSEKSSRAMEVLITSTSSNSLIFGKVFAATIASIVQVAVMIGSGVITYKVNSNAWNGLLDGIFAIPSSILIGFAIFGGIGYVFYAFIYAALGALVSKTEDVSKSIGSVTTIFIIVFFVAIFGLTNSDSIIVKVASFIPFSSCMSMVTRIAMGSVEIYEIVISALILIASTALVGILSAKIYRMGTLRYGNPIKLSSAIKNLKKNKKDA